MLLPEVTLLPELRVEGEEEERELLLVTDCGFDCRDEDTAGRLLEDDVLEEDRDLADDVGRDWADEVERNLADDVGRDLADEVGRDLADEVDLDDALGAEALGALRALDRGLLALDLDEEELFRWSFRL